MTCRVPPLLVALPPIIISCSGGLLLSLMGLMSYVYVCRGGMAREQHSTHTHTFSFNINPTGTEVVEHMNMHTRSFEKGQTRAMCANNSSLGLLQRTARHNATSSLRHLTASRHRCKDATVCCSRAHSAYIAAHTAQTGACAQLDNK